jgi:peptidoglycan/xylan/chitin deacetylase (PgdA/CDA1 family)
MNSRSRQHRKRRKNRGLRTAISFLVLIIIAVAGLVIYSQMKNTKSKTASTLPSKSTITKKSSVAIKPIAPVKPAAPAWQTVSNENELPILMYHYVTSNAEQLPNDSNNMNVKDFEAQLQLLKMQGYKTLTADEAEKVLTGKTRPSAKMVWLTFDDGSSTVYSEIYPLLKKYQMHATSFIITGFVDKNQGGILTWAQIKEMKASGWIDFGSHTVDHLDLGTLSNAEQQRELADSKADLDRELGQNTTMICYPAGGYNQETESIAQSLGYQYGLLDPGRNGAVAVAAKGSDGLFTLPRFRMMSTTTTADLAQMLQPAADYNAQNK